MLITYIYVLLDPETGLWRYLGKSDNPISRAKAHIKRCDENNSHKNNWIRSLRARGLNPRMEIIDEIPYSEWAFWEQEYLRIFRAINLPLTNSTEGGEAGPGGNNRGKKFSPSHCKNLSESHKGKPAWNRGNKLSPEICKKVSEKLTGLL